MESEAPAFILDSYAILAHLEGEAGAGQVGELLAQAQAGECRLFCSLINLGEVIYITERERGINKARAVLAAIQQLPIEMLPVDQEAVLAAAHLKANYRIAYSDAFAAAAAQAKQAALVTGDPEFRLLEGAIRILWVGPLPAH